MTLSPRAASRITLGLALLAAASPAFAQTTGGVGGSLTGFLQMPPDHLIVLKAGSLPVRGRKITYHRERPFQARLLPAPLVPARAPPSATAQPRRPVPEPTDGLLSLDIVAATLASADPQPPPQGAADAEIETWVDRFLETPPPVTRRHDMSDRPDITNRMQTAGAARSTQAGDVPDALRRRYLTETGRGHASIAYYVDASVLIPSFRDGGRELVATRSDPNTVSDLICIAQHRGWSQVQVRGATGFRREAWLAGRVAGLEVDGYRPGARDLQILQCRVDGRAHRTTPDRETPESTATERRRGTQPTPRERVRIVEAVVRDGVNDPSVRARIIAAARSRLAGLLERPPPRQSPARTVERNRSR